MAKPLSRYEIELDITNSDATKQAISQIENSLQKISESARSNDLANALVVANDQANNLAKTISTIDRNSEGATEQLEAYGKAANKAISELEKQATRINYSLSNEGKAERELLQSLKEQLKTLGDTKAEKAKAKEIEKEIAQLQRKVIDGSDEYLEISLQRNRAARATLKMAQQEARLSQAQAKTSKTLSQLVKADLKALKDKLKLQMQFIQSLRTTEGRYNALKKAASTVGSATLAAGKAGLKGAGIAGAGLLAISGMALSQADSYVQKEREANRIKATMSPEEKQNLLSDLYIQSGADYTTIVDAINRVIGVLGTNAKPDDILRATATEIRYPGSAAMFRQQNTTVSVHPAEFVAYGNRLKAIQQSTGASVEQITDSTQKIANLRQSSFSNASMSELQALYLALQNSGAFDSDDELDRAFKSFVRVQKDSNKSVFDLAKEWQDKGTWTRTAYGATNKTQALNAISNLDFGAVQASTTEKSTETGRTQAEISAIKIREIEEAKNRILMKLVEAIAPVIDSIDVDELSDFVSFVLKEMAPILREESKVIVELTRVIREVYTALAPYFNDDVKKAAKLFIPFSGVMDSYKTIIKQQANGGLVSMPSLCGEAGTEMVIPLDYSRFARGKQLTQNLNQYFNMSGNQTTALSLSQAVQSRDFTRAMANNSFINGRLGR